MNIRKPSSSRRSAGFTLVEMSLVIGVMVALLSMGLYFNSSIGKWKAGKNASVILQSVQVAQRMYLADHPTTAVSALTTSQLLPYLPDKAPTFPKVTGLDKVQRNIKVTVSPPVVIDSNGSVYDPSGNSKDSLWDVGE